MNRNFETFYVNKITERNRNGSVGWVTYSSAVAARTNRIRGRQCTLCFQPLPSNSRRFTWSFRKFMRLRFNYSDHDKYELLIPAPAVRFDTRSLYSQNSRISHSKQYHPGNLYRFWKKRMNGPNVFQIEPNVQISFAGDSHRLLFLLYTLYTTNFYIICTDYTIFW